MALLNGLSRGHWFRFGIAADTVVCLSMTGLYFKERRKVNGAPR
jgi:hypothetical protein